MTLSNKAEAHLIARSSVPTTPVTSAATFFFASGGSGCNSLGMEKLKYPQFEEKLANYPSWKFDWSQLVNLRMDEPTELLKLREVVPKDTKMELKNLNTLDEAWVFLDSEFSDQDRCTAEIVRYLHAFQYCKVQG